MDYKLMTTLEPGLGISPKPPTPGIIGVNYSWLKDEIRQRLGYLPDDVEDVLTQLDKEQRN